MIFCSILGQAAASINQQDHGIGLARTAPGIVHHGAVQLAPGLEDARRIDQHDLGLALHDDGAESRPRRLHLVADDGHLGTGQLC